MSREAEDAVLGGLLQDNSMIDQISLEPDHFEHLDNKIIFQAMLNLKSQDITFDCVTLSEGMEHSGQLEYVGGLQALVQLQNNTPSARNVPAYAKIIIRDYKSKQLEQKGHEIVEIAKSHGDFEPKLEESLGLFDELTLEGEKDLQSIDIHVSEYYSELERRIQQDGIDGLETGFRTIDQRLKGLKSGELYIIAGRPASGKSTYALNIANYVAKNHKTIFFSMEMPSKQIVEKSVASLGDVDLNWLKEGLKEDSGGWDNATAGMAHLKESKLVIDDNGFQTVQSIKVKCKKQGRLGLVVVDYLQLMSASGNNRTEQIGEISRGLKMLAKELECPVIALSQLNRGVENRPDKRPQMSDLRDSGAIEQDADVIQFIYRDEYYYPDCDTNKFVAEINTAKYRHGAIGKDELTTCLARSQFKNLEQFGYVPYEKSAQSNPKNNSFANFQSKGK